MTALPPVSRESSWHRGWRAQLATTGELAASKMGVNRATRWMRVGEGLADVHASLDDGPSDLPILAAWAYRTGLSIPEVAGDDRSEERRVGKECRSRWSPYH